MNEHWKKRLYERYVSSGQAGANVDRLAGLRLAEHAYALDVIKRFVPRRPSLKILDLACGHGALVWCLTQSGFTDAIGVDGSAEQVQLAHELNVPQVIHGDIVDFLRDGAGGYELIFMMDVLEHFTKPELFDLLDRVQRALLPGGRLIVHVPNAEGVFGMRIRYGDLTHENCFTPTSITQALDACGFEHVRCFEDQPVVHGLKSAVRFVLWRALTAPVRLLLLAETGTGGHILSQNMLVVCERSPRDQPPLPG